MKYSGRTIITCGLIAFAGGVLFGLSQLSPSDRSIADKEKEGNTLPLPLDDAFLKEEEVVVIPPESAEEEEIILPVEEVLFEYVQIKDSCGVHYDGACVRARSGPGTEFPVVTQLRNNVILKIGGKVENEGITWYKIVFDEHLRYPERVMSDWYVAATYVNVLRDEGEKTAWNDGSTTTPKKIIIDKAKQKLFAYEGAELFMETTISTGLELSPTPEGTFTIFKKTPSRYMQGPLPGFSDVYDLPGVPWNLYFTHDGAVIHGAYWHDSFGAPYSHGCVNLSPQDAERLYNWAVLGTTVIVE
jgi:lipoprotein-anchoring transpeptidase ErfK/SrfK